MASEILTTNENWEEINEWEIEEDIDLAQRITVHTVHSIINDNEEEYQLIQSHKHPTYAAAAKWGERKLTSSKNEDTSKKVNKTLEKKSPKDDDKISTLKNDDKTSKNDETSASLTSTTSSTPSTSSEDVISSNDDENIPKGDHDVDYDTASASKTRKETRRNNTRLHKIQNKKLLSSLISNAELDCNQDLVKGDTNRDPEFKNYKLLKKSLALNKKYAEKSKNDRGKFRVEVYT